MTDSDALVEAHSVGLTDNQISDKLKGVLNSSPATPRQHQTEGNNGHQTAATPRTVEAGNNGHSAQPEQDLEPIAPERPSLNNSNPSAWIDYEKAERTFAREHQAWIDRQTAKGPGNKANAAKIPQTPDISHGPTHQGPATPARPATVPVKTGFGTASAAPRPTAVGPTPPTSIK